MPFSATRSTGQCATSLTAGPGSGEYAALGGGAARTRGREEGEREGVTSNIGGERERNRSRSREGGGIRVSDGLTDDWRRFLMLCVEEFGKLQLCVV